MELKVRGGKNNKISTRYFSQKATLITLVLRPHHESPNTQKTSSKTKVYADITKIARDTVISIFFSSSLKTSIEKIYYCNAFQILIPLTTKCWTVSK